MTTYLAVQPEVAAEEEEEEEEEYLDAVGTLDVVVGKW